MKRATRPTTTISIRADKETKRRISRYAFDNELYEADMVYEAVYEKWGKLLGLPAPIKSEAEPQTP